MNDYRIDPGLSQFTVQGFATGLLSALAHSPTFAVRSYEGIMRLGRTAESFEIELTLDAHSLELVDRVPEFERREIERRMWDEVLEASTYRELTIHGQALSARETAQGYYGLTLAADLTLHGMTSRHEFGAELIVFADGLRLGGQTSVKMSDHGIRTVSALRGTIRLKDELQIT
ncbi:MAG: YceI family protein, partial [Isosphaeraceae bacterium]